jgi:transglutaminase-like putative cysteine protease
MARPDGLAPGAAGLALAWLGGVAIARLTGATPVVIVLALGLATVVVAAGGGWWKVTRARFGEVVLPPVSTAGEPVPIDVRLAAARSASGSPVWLELHAAGELVGRGWAGGGPIEARFVARGEVTELDVTIRAAGALGLVWWRRRVRLTIDPHVVAPPAVAGTVVLERQLARRADDDLDRSGRTGAIAGDTDGVRAWREGDSERSVHWPSTLRSGELVVHDRHQPIDCRTVVRADADAVDPDAEAGAALAAALTALNAGDEVWVAVGRGDPVAVADRSAAIRWAATAPLGPPPGNARRGPRLQAWLQRRVEPETTARVAARWWAAGATAVALLMMAGSLGHGAAVRALAVVGVLAGAAVSARTVARGGELSVWIRAVVGGGALVSIAAIAAGAGRLEGLLAVLRGPLPQLLIVLIVLHGFECRDRRTIRVGLAISAVVVMYAAGFRVDRTLALWLAAWGICCGVSLALLARPTDSADSADSARHHPRLSRGVATVAVTAALTVGVLAVVPVPDGAARLTLPTFIDEQLPVGQPGALAGPDGTLRPPGDTGGDERSRQVSPSDYTGFAEALDTNVRGELGDQVVLRVRAGQPDFWRGQTFSTFDGRVWHADAEPGELLGAASVTIPPAFGDARLGLGRYTLPPESFTQTYFVEADLPNVLFHAYQPDELVIDAEVWGRQDGALRASTVLPAGSVYTVVSSRRPVTPEWLRRSGMVGARLSPMGRDAFARYLAVPDSTTAETRELAAELAAGYDTTYDIVRAYEAWIDANVTYDLYAPLPDEGEDAVHELLFDSRRGFCEQIASALVVMLRTQGVPARLATGYAAGRRDPVAGVWEVRASDAHAWAEVWFPEVGWQAFDPTAGVPLAGDARATTIGAGILSGATDWAGRHPARVAAGLAMPVAGVVAWRVVAELLRRRRRGGWGLLQDRFSALAGAPDGATNRRRAERWTAADDAAVAHEVAHRLDRAAFDPTWPGDQAVLADTRQLVDHLAKRHRDSREVRVP